MGKNWKFSRFGVVILLITYHNLIHCRSLNDEGMALLKVRERVVTDPYGALKEWKDEVGVIDPCPWFGIECSDDGKVVVLNFKDLCLGGTLAPEVRNLVHIKSIVLRNNSFTGVFPEGIGELKELEVLDLGYNKFSGPLPPDLGNHHSLTILLLDNSGLPDHLSPEIHQLNMLSEFQVDEYELSNAVKGSSCNGGLIRGNFSETEKAVYKRKMLLTSSSKSDARFFNPYAPFSLPTPAAFLQPPTGIVPSPLAKNSSTPSPPQNINVTPPPNLPPSAPPPSVPSPSPPDVSTKSVQGSSSKHRLLIIISGSIAGILFLLILVIGLYLCKTHKATVKPATGLSHQLQKAFITGVPKLKRSELEAGCEDFSNVIGSSPIGTLYKGTLSSGVEIAVASVAVTSAEDWSETLEIQFRNKIETLSKVNHKNFVNLLGYCEEEEPFTRMMVFEYAPNGTLFEHLHIKESEHLDWGMRLRIAMGMAYCLEHMHQLNPPIAHNNLNSSSVSLTEDYAAKISDFSFLNEITATGLEASAKKLFDIPLTHPESNVYSFGVLLFEMITGRLPYSVDSGSLEDWASDYLRGDEPLKEMVDPTLESFEEEKLERMYDLVKSCVNLDPNQRPSMREVSGRLREITAITPNAAIPKLSPLWWAELEISSPDAN